VHVDGQDELREEIRTRVARLAAEDSLREHDAAHRLGLGGTDTRFLTLLALNGPLTPGRLATLTGLTTGSVTGVIDRLERAGYVVRERDDADRRKVLVVPVAEANARFEAERGAPSDRLATALRRLGGEELKLLARVLDEVDASRPNGDSSPIGDTQ
jgi:DNA-binding MarR family transcriptional regulator